MLIRIRHCEERSDEAIQRRKTGLLRYARNDGDALMIARRWHGRVPADKAEEYLKLTKEVGLADYRRTSGNLGAWCLHRREGDVVHVETFSFWENEAAIRRFAGEDMLKAKYYDFDPDFLLEMEPEVLHFEVIEGS
jgi:heme-degrading monooxygenase HmoA